MPHGTVKFFNAGKGFGFITADEGEKDVFVPSASVTASGLATLKPGQRVSFEEVPDAKGPKAANLVLLAEAPRPVVEKEQPRPRAEPPRTRLTFYHDPESEWSEHVLEEIRALGHQPAVVNYRETPPTKDELRRLSRLLQGIGQSLVRKYDSLFFELQLDDRFIGESEFWDAIVEHPVLINGPLLATDGKAGLLHTDESIPGFFTAAPPGELPAAKPKGLSLRALQILAGGDAAPAAPQPAANKPVPAPVAEVKTLVRPVVEAAAAPAPKAEAAPARESQIRESSGKERPLLKAKSGTAKPNPKEAVKAKPVVKAKAPAKPAAKKPAKKR
jgi:cold shock CspA family protein/arsenate reductase-like glutaredoxin family protein